MREGVPIAPPWPAHGRYGAACASIRLRHVVGTVSRPQPNLAAVDAPAYLMHVGPAKHAGVTLEQAQNVLVAATPIIDTPRTEPPPGTSRTRWGSSSPALRSSSKPRRRRPNAPTEDSHEGGLAHRLVFAGVNAVL